MLVRLVVHAISSLLLYIASLIVYRLYFHPFAKYPGPLLAKISFLHAFYHAWIGDILVDQLDCHRKYGHVVRYNPDSILFDEPAAIKEIHGYGKNFWKGKAYAPLMADPHARPNIGFTSDKEEHARRRRIISQGLSFRAIQDSQSHIKEHVDALCGALNSLTQQDSDHWSEPLDIHDIMRWTTQDIITDLVFGKSYNMVTDPRMREASKAVSGSLRRSMLVLQYPGIFRAGTNHPLDLGRWILPRPSQSLGDLLKMGAQSTMERINNPPEDSSTRNDILSYLISAKDEDTGTGIDKRDIIAEASILLLAGGSATANSLKLTISNLSRKRNKKILEKLSDELHATYQSSAEILIDDKLEACTYLHAVVAESLRLSGGVAFYREAGKGGATISIARDPRVQKSTKDLSFVETETYFIPQGLAVASSRYTISRDQTIFPDAEIFAPERWLLDSDFYTSRGYTSDAAAMILEGSKRADRPFGYGPRSCIAERLAATKVHLVIAMLVWHFDFKLADEEEKRLEHIKDSQMFVAAKLEFEGPVVQFRRRAS